MVVRTANMYITLYRGGGDGDPQHTNELRAERLTVYDISAVTKTENR